MPNSRTYFLIILHLEYSDQSTQNFSHQCGTTRKDVQRNNHSHYFRITAPTALCFWNIQPNWHKTTGNNVAVGLLSNKKVYTRIGYNLSPYCPASETTSLCVWQIQSHWHQNIEANVSVGFLYNMKVCTGAKRLTLLPNIRIYLCEFLENSPLLMQNYWI